MTAKTSLRPVVGYLHQLAGKACRVEATDRQLLERFVQQRDQDAFRALVWRHGRLVMGVGLRALRHRQDAEDCFQATFLVLARKAGEVRWQESIAPWLYQVAVRVAAESRVRAARERQRQRHAASAARAQTADEPGLRDLAAVLDEELLHLPERLRGPLLLCCLHGQTRDQAAGELGLSLRTLERRLHAGRARLQARLLQRGISLSAGLAAWALAQDAGAAVGPDLVDATAASSDFLAGPVVSRAGELAVHALGAMAREKVRWLGGVLLALGLCMAGVAVGLNASAPPAVEHRAVATSAPAGNTEEGDGKEPSGKKSGKVQEIGTALAVQSGLRWLVRRQRGDGGWQLDAAQSNDVAATALALLPFLDASESGQVTGSHKNTIQRGLRFLVGRQRADGGFDGGMYAHAMVAWALADGYRLTGDARFKKPVRDAIDYIVGAQHTQGGWRYAPGQAGDTSVTVWHIVALKKAQQAGIAVPIDTFKKSSIYLDSVASDEGSAYSYVTATPASASMTAAGLYCRQLLGWEAGAVAMRKGTAHLQEAPPDRKLVNAYYYHFATRAMHDMGGAPWQEWEGQMATLLHERQERGGADDGSWSPAHDVHGNAGGRLFVTALSLLALQPCGQLTSVTRKPPDLKDVDTAGLWEALRSDELVKVRPAMQTLAAAPAQALPLLRKHLQRSEAIDPRRVESLIAELGAASFEKRNRAFGQLKALGEPATPALLKALEGNADLEVQRRLETLLDLAANETRTPNRLRELRGVQILELMATPEARAFLADLSKGTPDFGVSQAALAALHRLGGR